MTKDTTFTKEWPDEKLSGLLSSPVIKHTVNIAGHSTSVSLEKPFWDELHRIAHEEHISLSDLISRIDEARQINLSSALRLYVLYTLRS